MPTPTPTPQVTSPVTSPPAPTPTAPGPITTTAAPTPTPPPHVEGANDVGLLGTVALSATVIGVIVGWALKEFSTSLRGRADAKRERKAAERDRVLEYLHTGDTLTAAANGLAQAYTAKIQGRPVDATQSLAMVNQFNASQSQLSRLRLEIYLLGPEWAVTPTFDALNGAIRLQAATMTIEKSPGKAAYDEYLAVALVFKELRQEVMKVAKKKLGSPSPASRSPNRIVRF